MAFWARQWPRVLTVFDVGFAALRYERQPYECATHHHFWLRLGWLPIHSATRGDTNHTDVALTVTTRRYPKEPR